MAGYITHTEHADPVSHAGDTLTSLTTIDATVGAGLLVQEILRFASGRSRTRRHHERDEVAYVVSGRGILDLDGQEHALTPDMGVYIRAGESYEVVNDGIEDLVLISVTAPPASPPEEKATRKVTVNVADQPTIPAGKDREFKFVVNPEAGCPEVTQFVGWIPPGRAPTHYHLYDEVMYILDGEGVLHLDGFPDSPISTGTCIHLPPPVPHCVENTGDRPLRVLGVFHPAGDASEAYEEEANQQ